MAKMLDADLKRRLTSLGCEVPPEDDWLLGFITQKVEGSVSASCGTDVVPDGLQNAVIDNICGEYLFMKKQSGKLDGLAVEATIKSVQAGDTTVTFKDDSTPEQRFDMLIAALIGAGRSELACYRKIKW